MTHSITPEPFPVLETERLVLRKLALSDADVLHTYWTDPAVTEYFTLDPFQSIDDTLNMIALLIALPETNQGYRWAITRKTDQVILGTCGFHNNKPEHRRIEMGYELGKAHWKQGYMSEALNTILNHGFTTRHYNRIEAFVNYGNIRSTQILKRMGFSQDGLLREYEFARGHFVDQYCYSLLRKEFCH